MRLRIRPGMIALTVLASALAVALVLIADRPAPADGAAAVGVGLGAKPIVTPIVTPGLKNPRGVHPEFDQLAYRLRKNKRVRLTGTPLLLKAVGSSAANYLAASPVAKGLKGIASYLLVYNLDHQPARAGKLDDAVASATINGTIFHDGYGYRNIIGPFSVTATWRPSACRSKVVFLPDVPQFQPGAKVPITLNFPRTRQHISAVTTVGAVGTPDLIPQVNQAAVAMGCPIDKDPQYATSRDNLVLISGPGWISPATRAPAPR